MPDTPDEARAAELAEAWDEEEERVKALTEYERLSRERDQLRLQDSDNPCVVASRNYLIRKIEQEMEELDCPALP